MQARKLVHIVAVMAVLAASLFVFSGSPVSANCGVYHTVVSGQNLFRISLRYGVSIQSIASANGIADVRRIYAGQVLYIPCAGGQSSTPPVTTTNPTDPIYFYNPNNNYTYPQQPSTGYPYTPPATYPPQQPSTIVPAPFYPAVDCGGFRGTSPSDFRDGVETFYWDAPRSGANVAIYQVNVLDDRGRVVTSFSSSGAITSATANVGFNAIGGRSRFSWYVVALVNGNEVCRTAALSVQREWNPNAGISPQS